MAEGSDSYEVALQTSLVLPKRVLEVVKVEALRRDEAAEVFEEYGRG